MQNYEVAEKKTGNTQETVEYVTPRASLAASADTYVLRIEMPGVNSANLDVSVEDNELTVIGHRVAQTQPGEAIYRESRKADYRRAFELDPSLDTSRIEAKMENGVLTLTLHKAENRKPRKIQVQD